MYTKEEKSHLRKAFWTAFGQYMQPLLSADGNKVNWINYKTGVKNIYFRCSAEQRLSYIAIEINHPDEGIRELFFEQFTEFKTLFHNLMGEEWQWEPRIQDAYGRSCAMIYKELHDVNVFNKERWPEVISFLKPRLVLLDEFWVDIRDTFDALK